VITNTKVSIFDIQSITVYFSIPVLKSIPINFMDKRDKVAQKLLPVMDTMELLTGKWKIIILTTLYIGGKMRFNDIKNSIPKITGRVLANDLRTLEENQIVIRTVKDTSPITVEYELTAYGKTLDIVFNALTNWGIRHRKKMMGK
jgi:DNA-binding HxlR family transcriptional regulator